MLQIKPSLYIGRGKHRDCFVHPENPNLCIKIAIKQNHAEIGRELSYYQFLEQRNISWDMISRFRGVIEMDRGDGAIFDLIRDYDGNISKTLDNYLADTEKTEAHTEGLSKAFAQLR